MKNIQVIDGAVNSVFEVYQVPDNLFRVLFPRGTDIAFTNEVDRAFRKRGGRKLWNVVYGHPVDKKRVRGIHGTLHLTASSVSKKYFPTRKEAEVTTGGPIAALQRSWSKSCRRPSKTGFRQRVRKR